MYSLPVNHGTPGGPFRANIIGRAKRSGVVDYRAATDAFAGQQSDAVIGSSRSTAFGIQALISAEFRAVEIGVVVIAAGLENENVFSSAGQHGSGSASSGAGTDHANFAGEIQYLAGE